MAVKIKKAHGGKVKGFSMADGNGPATGMPGPTPAPTRPFAPDVISHPRAPVGAGYGMSGGAENPSSIAPGVELSSQMSKVLRDAQNDGEDALGKLIAGGTHDDSRTGIPDIDDEERTVSAEQYPPAHGMKQQQQHDSKQWSSLPATLGASRDDSAARLADRLNDSDDA